MRLPKAILSGASGGFTFETQLFVCCCGHNVFRSGSHPDGAASGILTSDPFSAPVTNRISNDIIHQNSTPVKPERLSKSHSLLPGGSGLFVAFAMTGHPYSSPPMSAAAPMSKEEVPAPSAKARGGESRWMGARLCSFM